jgi:hypothetical protein
MWNRFWDLFFSELSFSLKDEVSRTRLLHYSHWLLPPSDLRLFVQVTDYFEWASEHSASQEFWNVSKAGYRGGKYKWRLRITAQRYLRSVLINAYVYLQYNNFLLECSFDITVHPSCPAAWCHWGAMESKGKVLITYFRALRTVSEIYRDAVRTKSTLWMLKQNWT